MTTQEMITSIVSELTVELQDDADFNADILGIKVNAAVREVKKARRYPMSYTQERIDFDLENYYTNIRNLALYDYNQVGVEGQQQASENNTNRTFFSRSSCLNGVTPICSFART